ncbi:ferrochelatase [Cucumibacter marinus]|uniref:ferrochelatase n=1 Tax=Cucumibacter marinus TaxID=1121252 RepID=UPI000491B247|nr:ferrochelatase [Cucumibacter marinus]
MTSPTQSTAPATQSSPLPADHPGFKMGKIGVLLLNLGTPDATDYWSMRRYLKEFLSDRRVIETPRLIWWPILNGIILTVRPKKSGANYDKIWDREAGDSPLRVIATSQAEKLKARMAGDERIVVDFAMRYGNPSTPDRLQALKDQGCDRILLVPLYPQYAASTTATANDKAFDALKTMRWQPAVRTVPTYHDDEAYVAAIAKSITDGLAKLDFEPQTVITSYHGVPKSYLDKGDPYHCFCHKTTRLVREKLGWAPEKLMLTFQSRFGPAEWLQPYTDKTLEALPGKGIKNVAILTPGFSVDCLETLEEIAMEGRESFLEAGGENYAYIPCLNDSDPGMDVIETLVRRELSGWL